MLTPLAGEIAVVTGAAQGLGEAIARALAAAGAQVAVTGRREEPLRSIADSLGHGHAVVLLDVCSTQSVEAAADSVAGLLGEATILVNNAGVNRIGPAEAVTDDDWDDVLDTNLKGAFRCSRTFGTRMLAARRGCIVNVGSIIGAVTAMPGRAPYAASKAGLVGLTRVLAIEWASRGVRVNAVLPGPTRTPMVEDAIARGILDEQQIADRTPAGRLALPEEIAAAVCLLACAEAGFVTGQTLVVDGGYVTYGAAGPLSPWLPPG